MEITIDEQIIERLGFEYYLIYKQLHSTYEKRKCLNKLLNGINGIIYIPLHFFFNDCNQRLVEWGSYILQQSFSKSFSSSI